MPMDQTRKIAKVIRETLAADFDRTKISDVSVRKGEDADGDELLRIEVVFEGTVEDVDASKILGAVRQVRPKLIELGENAFPLFSFIAQGDISAGRREPA